MLSWTGYQNYCEHFKKMANFKFCTQKCPQTLKSDAITRYFSISLWVRLPSSPLHEKWRKSKGNIDIPMDLRHFYAYHGNQITIKIRIFS